MNKSCSKCEENKPIERFYSYTHVCKDCIAFGKRMRYRLNPNILIKSLEAAKRRRKDPCYGPKMRAYASKKRFSRLGAAGQERVEHFRKVKSYDLLTRSLFYIFSNSRSVAKRRFIDFFLELDDIRKTWDSQKGRCYYSGIAMALDSPDLHVVSIDRVDSSQVYRPNNVVLCCEVINQAKHCLLPTEFIALCRDIMSYHGPEGLSVAIPAEIGRICKLCGQVTSFKNLSLSGPFKGICKFCSGKPIRSFKSKRIKIEGFDCSYSTKFRYEQFSSERQLKLIKAWEVRTYDPLTRFLYFILMRTTEGARKRNLSVAITAKDLRQIWEKQAGRCFYSGHDLVAISPHKHVVSIDRLDSSLGYELDNVVLCSAVINMMKSDLSVKDFKFYCAAVADH